MHHRFDESPDDYDMDMDQRTRMLGRTGAGRIILLGDGAEMMVTNLHDQDGDVDMHDRVEAEEDESEEKDLEEQVTKAHSSAKETNGEGEPERNLREETPGPGESEMTQKAEESKHRQSALSSTAEDMSQALDAGESRKLAEDTA